MRAEVPSLNKEVDDQLSRRPLQLDEAGYFIIRLDRESRELEAEFYTNSINSDGEPEALDVLSTLPRFFSWKIRFGWGPAERPLSALSP